MANPKSLSSETREELECARRKEWNKMVDSGAVLVHTGVDANRILDMIGRNRTLESRFVFASEDGSPHTKLKARWCIRGYLDPDVCRELRVPLSRHLFSPLLLDSCELRMGPYPPLVPDCHSTHSQLQQGFVICHVVVSHTCHGVAPVLCLDRLTALEGCLPLRIRTPRIHLVLIHVSSQ